MARYTANLKLYEKEPLKDGSDVFNIQTMLNDNFDKLDWLLDALANDKALSQYVSDRLAAFVSNERIGDRNGVAGLDENGKVPAEQLPAMDYIPTSQKGRASGVATLGSDGKVPTAQLPSMSSVQNLSYRGTGSYGSSESANTRINFGSFLPRFITITDEYGEYSAQFIISNSSGVKMYGFVTHMSGAGSSEESYEAHVVPCSAYMQRINGAYQFRFYSSLSAALQMNDSDITYHVVAVG